MDRVAVFVHDEHDTRRDGDKFRMRYSQRPAVSQPKHEWTETTTEAFDQEFHVHSHPSWSRRHTPSSSLGIATNSHMTHRWLLTELARSRGLRRSRRRLSDCGRARQAIEFPSP